MTVDWAPAKARVALNWMGTALRMLMSCAKSAEARMPSLPGGTNSAEYC